MRRVLAVALALVVVWVLAAASRSLDIAAAGVHYVSTAGDDGSAGTQAWPWRTLQYAADTLEPGETVVVGAGDYAERVHVTRSGSAGRPIAFRADGRVSMKGFTIRASHITVSGFHITGAPNDRVDGYGVYIEGSHNRIEDNHLYYNVRGGVILDSAAGTPEQTRENVVRNNRIERNALAGIDVRGQDNLVEGNDIWATVQHHPEWTDPPGHIDADGIRFHGGGHTFRKNRIHDISFSQPENVDPHIDCFQTWSDDSHEPAHDILFEDNFCKNLETQAENENGQGFMIEGPTRNLVLRNNVIMAYMGVNAHESAGLQIVNNTFVGSLQFTEFWPRGVRLVKSPGATVRDNIFVDTGSTGSAYLHVDSTSKQGLNAGRNLVHMSDGREPAGAPWPGDLWNIDPRFVDRARDDFRLRSDSPALSNSLGSQN